MIGPNSLAYAYHHMGDSPRAVAHYRAAIDLFRETGERVMEAETLVRIGHTHLAAGEEAEAHASWTAALSIFTNITHPDTEAVRHKLDKLHHSGADYKGCMCHPVS